MRTRFWFRTIWRLWIVLILEFAICELAWGGTRPVITRIADVPQFTYIAPNSTEQLIRSSEAFEQLAKPVQADLQRLETGYDIKNDALRRRVLEVMTKLDLLAGRYNSGINQARRLRAMQTKTSLKLTTMLVEEAYMQAAREIGDTGGELFIRSFRRQLEKVIIALPYDSAWVNLVAIRGFTERNSAQHLIAETSQVIEPVRKKTGAVSRDAAWQLVDARCDFVLSAVGETTIAVIRKQEISHGNAPKGIWPERSIVLEEHRPLTPVIVAIWDSGVDASLFPGRMWTKLQTGKADPASWENNGSYGIAYTATGERSPDLLWPLNDEEKQQSNTLSALVTGQYDLFANPDSPEAEQFRTAMKKTPPGKIEHLLTEVENYRIASHGTMCASSAAAGNPFIRIVSARTSADFRLAHQPPSVTQSQADARTFRKLMRYFHEQNVRIVNISWGNSPQEFEQALEKYGNEQDPARRKQEARAAFAIEKQGLHTAMASEPSILFVVASGNSDEDPAGAEIVPQSFNLPNLITVGAVDHVGNAAPFTTFGPSVGIYASGFQKAPLLGGRMCEFVGTSAAAPAAVNLAAKLLAVKPSLSPPQLIDFMKRGGSRNGEGLLVLNPKRSMQILNENMRKHQSTGT